MRPGSSAAGRWRAGASTHLRFRLRGSTDEATEQLIGEVKELLTGVPERDLARMVPEVMAGILPRIYPRDARRGLRPSGRRPADVHRQRRRRRARRAARPRPRHGRRDRHPLRGRDDGRFTGELDGPFIYGEGKVVAMRRLRRRARHRPRASRGPTPTPPRTCRCCAPSATRSPSTPIPSWRRIAREEGWRVMRFEKLGRRLRRRGGRDALMAAALGSRAWRGAPGDAIGSAPWTPPTSPSRGSRARRS